MKLEKIKCACDCKKELNKYDNRGRERRYIHGHNKSALGKKHTEETIEKIKKARAKQIFTEETRAKMSKAQRGSKNYFWKGGRYQSIKGYILIWKPDHPKTNNKGYIYEHRLIMEKHIGRYLTKDEVVHHKNGIKNDNRIENLKLFSSNSEHIGEEFRIKRNAKT